MASSQPPKAGPPPLRTPLVELGIGAAWLLAVAAAAQIVTVFFQSNPLATIVIQAVVVDLAAGKAGVRWNALEDSVGGATPQTPTADDKSGNETKIAALGIGRGAGLAAAISLVSIFIGVGLGWAKITPHGPTTTLGLGLLRAIAFGVRDAQLYAGLPLLFMVRAALAKDPKTGPKAISRILLVVGVVFGGLAAGASLALQSAATPANVSLTMAVTLLVAALWAKKGAGWEALGVASGWVFIAGAMFRGGLFDVDWKKGALGPGFVADGAPAWVCAGLFALAAIWTMMSPRAHQKVRR